MTHRFPVAYLLALGLAAVGCAEVPHRPPAHAYRKADLRSEALAIEAAKRHPNAQPRDRPQYPEQQPTPLPQGTAPAPPAYVTRRTQPSMAEPAAAPPIVEPRWSGAYDRYNDYPPSGRYSYVPWYGDYAVSYPYPRYGFGLSLGWGSRHSWDGWTSWGRPYGAYYDPWAGHRYGGSIDRPHSHRLFVDHQHGGFRHSLGTPSLSAPGRAGFHGGGGGRAPRTDIRVRR